MIKIDWYYDVVDITSLITGESMTLDHSIAKALKISLIHHNIELLERYLFNERLSVNSRDIYKLKKRLLFTSSDFNLDEEFHKFNCYNPQGRRLHPHTVYVSTINQCNLKCYYCSISNRNSSPASSLIFKQLIEEISCYAKKVVIAGGEPFLDKNLYNHIAKLTESGVVCYISTNGTPLSSRSISKLIKSGVKFIQVSLDTLDPNIFEKMTLTTFLPFNIIESIEELIDAGINVVVRTVISRDNFESIHFLVEKLQEYNIISHNISFATTSYEHLRNDVRLIFSQDEMDQLENKLAGYSNVNFRKPIRKWLSDKNAVRCGMLEKSISILANGDIYACEHHDIFKIGSVINNKLADVWSSEAAEGMHYLVNNQVYDSGSECFSCDKKESCKGGCPAEKMLIMNNMLSKDPRCELL